MVNQTKGIISSVLSPACRAWLRSQVSQVEHLDVDIAGGSRQILAGTIPRVRVTAIGAVYEGLSLGSIDLVAEDIRINLPQVIRGKPLQLLAPIGMIAQAKFTEVDLQASLTAPILSQAISDLVTQILAADPQEAHWRADWQQIQIAAGQLVLRGNITTTGQTAPIEITMGIDICDGHTLNIDPLSIVCDLDLPGGNITSHRIDLGNDVNITQLILSPGELICHGRIQVNP